MLIGKYPNKDLNEIFLDPKKSVEEIDKSILPKELKSKDSFHSSLEHSDIDNASINGENILVETKGQFGNQYSNHFPLENSSILSKHMNSSIDALRSERAICNRMENNSQLSISSFLKMHNSKKISIISKFNSKGENKELCKSNAYDINKLSSTFKHRRWSNNDDIQIKQNSPQISKNCNRQIQNIE